MARRLKAHNPTKRAPRKVAEVEVRNIAHPRIWETAIKLAEGNMTRVTVESPTCVSVLMP